MKIAYISFVAGNIFIDNVQGELVTHIKDLGGQKDKTDPTKFIIQYNDEKEKIKLFIALRDLGIAFSAGNGWSPSEQFEDLRERKLITGKYKHIGWSDAYNYCVDER